MREEIEKQDVVVDSEANEMPCAVQPLIQREQKQSNGNPSQLGSS